MDVDDRETYHQLQGLLREAAAKEAQAWSYHREGSIVGALECFRDQTAKLLEARELLPEADDATRREINQRVEEAWRHVIDLKTADAYSLCGDPAATAAAGQQRDQAFANSQLSQLSTSSALATAGTSSSSSALPELEARKRMGAAAAIGGVAGLVLLGPFSAVSLGAAAAYATTCDGAAGDAARRASELGLRWSSKATDTTLRIADQALEEGGRRLQQANRDTSSQSRQWVLTQRDTCARALDYCRERLPHKRSSEEATANRRRLSEEAAKIKERLPDRVPVICQRAPYTQPNLSVPEQRWALPGTMRCNEFTYLVHRAIAQHTRSSGLANQTIYIFVNGITPKSSLTMMELYQQHKSDDGFLHVQYSAENTLGFFAFTDNERILIAGFAKKRSLQKGCGTKQRRIALQR